MPIQFDFQPPAKALKELGASIVSTDQALRRAIASVLGVPPRYFRQGHRPAEYLPERWFGEHIESYVYRCPEALDNPTIRWEYQVYILSAPLRWWQDFRQHWKRKLTRKGRR